MSQKHLGQLWYFWHLVDLPHWVKVYYLEGGLILHYQQHDLNIRMHHMFLVVILHAQNEIPLI